MNDISMMFQNTEPKNWESKFLDFTDLVLKELKIDNWEFSITICDDEYIHQINKEYRKKDKPTDVITFAMCDEPFPVMVDEDELYCAGDIIISLDSVKENSKYFNVEYEEELKRVLIHGILHLDGMDHETNNPDEEMLQLQERILTSIPKIGIFKQ